MNIKKIALTVTLGTTILGGLVGCGTTQKEQEQVSDHKYITLEVVDIMKDTKSVMLYDKTAEYEPNILYKDEYAYENLDIGWEVCGQFDKEGWELQDIVSGDKCE